MPGEYESTVLITGGTSGVGWYAALDVAAKSPNTLVIIASRSPPKLEVKASNIQYMKLDLVSRSSISDLANQLKSLPPLSAYVANAGYSSGGKPIFTPDGVENDFTANYLGHAYLFFLLKDSRVFSPDCRMVFVTSGGHDPEERFNAAKPAYTDAESVAKAKSPALEASTTRYSTVKVAVVLFAYCVANRAKGSGSPASSKWTSVAYDPAFAPGQGSNLTRNQPAPLRFMVNRIIPYIGLTTVLSWFGMATSSTPASGAALARLVLDPQLKGVSGKYFQVLREKPSSKQTYDTALQEDLWNWSVKELAKTPEQKTSFDRF